jgi:D-beta-D-heptose 7-phosphate kinase/D-beta-D-heptose 1-phosphate adenosyltransferase
VDAVVLFDEATPLTLIRRLRPDVLAKGADYAREAIVGADDVEAWGGRVVRVPLVPGYSTTELLTRLRGGASK